MRGLLSANCSNQTNLSPEGSVNAFFGYGNVITAVKDVVESSKNEDLCKK